MLQNQTFIDPSIAIRIKSLQTQLSTLIKQKLQIQSNYKLKPQTKTHLLKINQDHRIQLRKIIQKCKLSMVEYFDKQQQVINIDCIEKGKLVNIQELKNNQIKDKSYSIATNDCTTMMTKSNKFSSISSSTNYHQNNHNRSSSYSSDNLDSNNNNFINNSNNKYENTSSISNYQTSEFYHPIRSSIKSCVNTSLPIMQINQFNITQKLQSSLQQSYSQRQEDNSSISYHQPATAVNQKQSKVSILDFIKLQREKQQNEQYQSQQHFASNTIQNLQQTTQLLNLYQQKILMLENKCKGLENDNIFLTQMIDSMSQTIDEQQKRIQQLQVNIDRFKQFDKDPMYMKMKKGQMQMFNKADQRQIQNLQKPNELFHLPLTHNNNSNKAKNIQSLMKQQQNNRNTTISGINNILNTNSNITTNTNTNNYNPNYNTPVINTTTQIFQLVQKVEYLMKQLQIIREQNQQLKIERKLLLKKIKI